MSAESYVEDDPIEVKSSAYGGSPIMAHARVPSGVEKVNANGITINERTVKKDITQSKEFLEAFGADVAAKMKNISNNHAVTIIPDTIGKPIDLSKIKTN
jgi:hypothetical protein